MKNITLPEKWIKILNIVNIAFQPILNSTTGTFFAVEALLRNYKEAKFNSIFELFDAAYEDKVLYNFDILLREKTIKKFSKLENYRNLKIFYNLDNRLLQLPNYKNGNTAKILKKYNLERDNICFEISERHNVYNIQEIITHYKNENYCVAIDDFGVGYSGYKLFYEAIPDIVKIDRLFIENIDAYNKKKIMVKSIVNLARQFGVKIIAEGVETQKEFLTCKDIGCEYVQGYFIQKPTTNLNKISSKHFNKHSNIAKIIKNEKRAKKEKLKIENYIQKIETIHIKSDMEHVIGYFKRNNNFHFAPIVNKYNEPKGIIEEKELKNYLYNSFGREILLNPNNNFTKLKELIKNIPIIDKNSSILDIIEIYTNSNETYGVIVSKNGKYYGFLSSRAIIEIMHNRSIFFAREQNPLTKLPGNTMIEEYVDEALLKDSSYIFCYFDLDNFKAFNDKYGFRNGDRIIIFFADMMKKELSSKYFKAHIGGDDFFCSTIVKNENEFEKATKIIKAIVKKFENNAIAFYSKEDRDIGYIRAKDREGIYKNFPLISVSASILIIKNTSKYKDIHSLNDILSKQKKVAKKDRNHIAMSIMI